MLLLAAVVLAWMGCGGEEKAEPVASPTVQEVLENWKHEYRVSLDCREKPLADVVERVAGQSGFEVEIDPFQEDRDAAGAVPVTVKLADVPFWRAIAEVSKVSGVGFEVTTSNDGHRPKVQFSADLPPLVDYRLAGPILVGLVKPGADEDGEDTATVGPHGREFDVSEASGREVRLRVTGFHSRFRDTGVPEIVPTGPDGKDLGEPIAATAGEMGLSDGEVLFHVPDERTAKATGFRGYLDAEVVYNVQTLDLPVTADGSLERDGLHAKITGIEPTERGTKVGYEVTWDTGLRGEDARRLRKIIKGEVAMPEAKRWLEDHEIISWGLVDITLLDDDGRNVGSFSRGTATVPDSISGHYTFNAKVSDGMTLRLKPGRRQSGRIPFSFPDALKAETGR